MKKKFKFCSAYRCGRLLPFDYDKNKCPHCGDGFDSEFSYLNHTSIKELPPQAYEIEMKCPKTGETEPEKLVYDKPWTGSFGDQYGNKFESIETRNAFYAEMDREEAMNYFLIDNSEGDVTFYKTKDDIEEELERMVREMDWGHLEGMNDNYVVLQVEPIKGDLTKKTFQDRNVFLYETEFYLVYNASEVTFEYDTDVTVGF